MNEGKTTDERNLKNCLRVRQVRSVYDFAHSLPFFNYIQAKRMAKQYGLIIPNKKSGRVTITRPSIFDDDSDSDVPEVYKPTGLTKAKKQDTINQQKAIEEDPTVYQYDEVYDEMENKKKESKLARKDIDKKPKYISKLLAAADRRKRENERRIERQVQKEREAEGDQYKDKESFVTSAYKKKLEEMKALEEQEKREEYLEGIGDVTKQGNLDGFYRHLYDQKVNYEDKPKEKEIKDEPKSDSEKSGDSRKRRSSNIDHSGSENEQKVIKKHSGAKKRKYRSRQDLGSDNDKTDSETEHVEVKKEHLPSNLDADSDFSVDSSSDKEDEENEPKNKIEHEGEKLQLPAKGNVLSDNAALSKKGDEKEVPSKNSEKQSEEEDKGNEEEPKKPKVDIWKKRTVGAVFDEAVKRYFERKATRGW